MINETKTQERESRQIRNTLFNDQINHNISDTRVTALNTILLERMVDSMSSVALEDIINSMTRRLQACVNIEEYQNELNLEVSFRNLISSREAINNAQEVEIDSDYSMTS
jgi:DNA primase large subunit